jgi:hypothetical protein
MQKLNVTEINKTDEKYVVLCKHTLSEEEIQGIKAGERMLVDSDGLAFVYILEDESQFYYLTFEQNSWFELYEAYKIDLPLVVELGNNNLIELSQLHAELDFLLENIEGNSNYGEELETAVREVFLKTVE